MHSGSVCLEFFQHNKQQASCKLQPAMLHCISMGNYRSMYAFIGFFISIEVFVSTICLHGLYCEDLVSVVAVHPQQTDGIGSPGAAYIRAWSHYPTNKMIILSSLILLNRSLVYCSRTLALLPDIISCSWLHPCESWERPEE